MELLDSLSFVACSIDCRGYCLRWLLCMRGVTDVSCLRGALNASDGYNSTATPTTARRGRRCTRYDVFMV